jgi:hypothetical protein
VTKVCAYECYADEDVFYFLRDDCRLPIRHLHGYGQGDVVNAVFVNHTADVGMVDEDPFSSHHSQRDKAQLVSETNDLALCRQGNRHLIIVKPDLEECFLRSMQRVRLDSKLPRRAGELRAILNLPNHAKHKIFREELVALHRESKARNVGTFVTDLEAIIRGLL